MTIGAAPGEERDEDRREREPGRACGPGLCAAVLPHVVAVAPQLLNKDDRHQYERHRKDGGDRGTREAACGKALVRTLDRESQSRKDKAREESDEHQAQAPVNCLSV